MYLGSWKIDDLLTFYANTTRFDTGNATDADAVPAYRIFEDETTTPILTGNMALLDSANTAGFYSEQITLSAANGFEKGKSYAIYIAATVNGVAGATHHTLQIEAEVDANVVSDKTGYALTVGERNSMADAWIARVIEGGHTLGDFMRLFASVLTGKSAGGGGATITFRDLADSKNRISATVDANGNRTAVGTRDGT